MEPTALLFLLGRILLGGYFMIAGVAHFRDRRVLAQYAASKGTPFPMLAVLVTGVLLLGGGASLASGIYPILGVAALVLFLVGTTPLMHAFWKAKEPMARMTEFSNFSRNVALIGALLILATFPAPWDAALPPLVLGGP